MKKAAHAKMYEAIRKHGGQLQAIFPTPFTDTVILCKKLRTIEKQAELAAVDYCNGKIDSEQWEQTSAKLLGKLNKILNFSAAEIPVFINSDPRGYALKIRSEWMDETRVSLHRDWGGYGIIAPDFTPSKED
ncbi:MAG: hypothetical protein M0R74_19325 [Dehalococcoidia bacterium]|jgi:hypothetical protein|nr:hypothetical protein [Dehalococcoidia bacterium]